MAAAARRSIFLLPRLLRPLSTSSSISSAGCSPAATNIISDLNDTEQLFGSAETGDLLRSLATLYALAMDPAVDLGMAAMKSSAVMRSPAVRAAVRGTVYRQFCAGEGEEEAAATVRRLWKIGVRGILDYGAEDAEDAEACDRNLAGFLRTVDMTATLPASSVSFACVKITAISPIHLLERISDLLRWQKKHPLFPLPWKQSSLPVLAASSPLYHTPAAPPPLTADEELELHRSQARLSALCRRCADTDLPLLVDAEYTSVQPAIDYLIFSAALQFNAGKNHPIVYGTIQSYLKDSKDRLIQAVDAAESAGISIGFKLVRGAYLSRENNLASSIGVSSPIHETIQETHACYNDCAGFMLDRIVKGSASVLLATHNLESGKSLKEG